MKKIFTYKIILIFAISLVLLSCKEANVVPIVPIIPQPTPKDSLWGDYFPNSPGTKWEYTVSTNSVPTNSIEISITKRVLLENKESVSEWDIKSNSGDTKQYVGIIGDTVKIYIDINNINNPQSILYAYILPLNKFNNWNYRNLEQTFGNDIASGGSLIGKLTVPAGTFDNVYEIERITDAQDRKAHEWIDFVPEIGMIKKQIIDNNTNDNIIWELKSFQIKK